MPASLPIPDSASSPNALPPAQALAAAIRDCLAAGAAVEMPGLGTLRRTHEPARVEKQDDGHRVLLPPRATLRFEPA